MISYMGSKNKYAWRIVNKIRQLAHGDLLYDLCCGSGALSYYWPGKVIMVDAGPWGKFWRIISENDPKDFATNYDTDGLIYFLRQAEIEPVPEDDIEYALRFLLLQMASFNGKPVNDARKRWSHEGLITRTVTLNKWRDAWKHIFILKEKIHEAKRADVHKLSFDNANLYIDPDYESTTGYPYTLSIKRFVDDNCNNNNIFLSHHVPLSGIDWDQIYNVTGGHRSFARVNTELLHIKLRSLP